MWRHARYRAPAVRLTLAVLVATMAVPSFVHADDSSESANWLSASTLELPADSQSNLFANSYDELASQNDLELSRIVARLAWSTMAVLLACVATLWVARRRLRGAVSGRQPVTQMNVEATLVLPNRAKIQLVRVDDQRIVVGLDANGLKTMCMLPSSFTDTLDTSAAALEDAASQSAAGDVAGFDLTQFDTRRSVFADDDRAREASTSRANAGDDLTARANDYREDLEFTRWKPLQPTI